jgi:hypothetical protein
MSFLFLGIKKFINEKQLTINSEFIGGSKIKKLLTNSLLGIELYLLNGNNIPNTLNNLFFYNNP